MKANYNLAKRKDPQTKTVKWYAVPASKGAMDTDETARMAVADTTLSKGEFKHVMEVASEKLLPLLLSGISVSIGDLGRLRLSFGSVGVEDMNDFDPTTMIKSAKLVFSPSKALKDAIAGAMGHYGQWDNAAKYIDPRTDEETHTVANVFPVHE